MTLIIVEINSSNNVIKNLSIENNYCIVYYNIRMFVM